MRLRIALLLVAAGVLASIAAGVLLLWPLHADGVHGSALRPHYRAELGFTASRPVPPNPTFDDLRRAGVRLPQDVVWHRRHVALGLAVAGLVLVATGATVIMLDSRRPTDG